MNKLRWPTYASVLGLCLLTSACVVAVRPRGVVVAPGVVVVAQPPPPAQVEVAPPVPGPGYVWLPGYWNWNGAAYVWYPGRYEVRPAGATVWISAAWVARGGRWVFRPGHWAYR